MPNSVARKRTPCSLATRPTVGGTVACYDKTTTTEKTRKVVVVFGAARNAITAMPREAYRAESTDFMRQRPIAQPAVKLPKMLNRPISESDQAATSAGSWHEATTPGRCVAMKAT